MVVTLISVVLSNIVYYFSMISRMHMDEMLEMNRKTRFELSVLKDYGYNLGGDFNVSRFSRERMGDLLQLYRRQLIGYSPDGVVLSSFICKYTWKI